MNGGAIVVESIGLPSVATATSSLGLRLKLNVSMVDSIVVGSLLALSHRLVDDFFGDCSLGKSDDFVGRSRVVEINLLRWILRIIDILLSLTLSLHELLRRVFLEAYDEVAYTYEDTDDSNDYLTRIVDFEQQERVQNDHESTAKDGHNQEEHLMHMLEIRILKPVVLACHQAYDEHNVEEQHVKRADQEEKVELLSTVCKPQDDTDENER